MNKNVRQGEGVQRRCMRAEMRIERIWDVRKNKKRWKKKGKTQERKFKRMG